MTETDLPDVGWFEPSTPVVVTRRIIGLSGYAGSGKDTVAKMLHPRGYKRIAFADTIRALALDLDPTVEDLVKMGGWEEAKHNGYVRRYLQKLGQLVRHHIHAEVWVEAAMRRLEPEGNYVFTDVRYLNEAEGISMFGGKLVYIERPGHEPANDHISEVEMDGHQFDAVLVNDGDLNQLFDKVMTLEEQLFS